MHLVGHCNKMCRKLTECSMLSVMGTAGSPPCSAMIYAKSNYPVLVFLVSVRVRPCVSDSVLFRRISDASPKLFCILSRIGTLDSTCYANLHCPLHPCLHMCCLCLFVS